MITPKGKLDLVISIVLISFLLLVDSIMEKGYYFTLILAIIFITIDILYDIFVRQKRT